MGDRLFIFAGIALALVALAGFVVVYVGRQPVPPESTSASPEGAVASGGSPASARAILPGHARPLLFGASQRGERSWCLREDAVAETGLQLQAPYETRLTSASSDDLRGTVLRRTDPARSIALYVAGHGELRICDPARYREAVVGVEPSGGFAVARDAAAYLRLLVPAPVVGTTATGDAFAGVALRDRTTHALWAYIASPARLVRALVPATGTP